MPDDIGVVYFAGFGVLVLIILVLCAIFKQAKPQIFNCMPITALGNKMAYGQEEPEEEPESFSDYNDLENDMPRMDDPYFNSESLMPQNNPQDPEWVQNFTDGNDKLLQQNFIDTQNYEKFQVTRSVCGRRFMSRDIRRTPTVTRDPTTVNSFNLPVIDPVCAKEYNEIRPPLDCF